MNKKTQQTLTVIGVGVVAFLGVRYLMNKTKKGSDEKKSNLVGSRFCTCADGTTGRCSTDCATCCARLGGVDEVRSVSSGGDFSTTVHRAKSKFSRADGAPCRCGN